MKSQLKNIYLSYRAGKRVSIILFSILAGNLLAQKTETVAEMDHTKQLMQLQEEVMANLTGNILPYWMNNMVDEVNGGFYGRMSSKEKLIINADRGGILNARILWTFSAAFRVLKDSAYLKMATHARDYILDHFIDKQYGGAFMSVHSNGEPADTRKQIYTQAFFIYALSEYYRITGDQESLSKAKEIFNLVEKHGFDNAYNGYFEVYTRDWQRLNDQLIGEQTDKDEKGMNTHIHLMEAYANLYRAWPDDMVAERLRNLINIFSDYIVDKQHFHLTLFLTEKWESTSSGQSFGHDIEASWLLVEAAQLLGDPGLLSEIQGMSIKMVNSASEGLNADGSLIYERDMETGHANRRLAWWTQAEAVVGLVNAYEITGNELYLVNAIKCWNFINNNLVDHKAGEWFIAVSESGMIDRRGDKAGFWKAPYHNSRMCLEIITRTSHLKH